MQHLEAWKNSLTDAQNTLNLFLSDPQQIEKCSMMTKIFLETCQKGGVVFACGNGGSHCDAMHFAEEMTGRYRKDRRPLSALALGDPSHITCVSNDYGFQYIFSRQVEALGRSGDTLLALSTSGNSENVILAVEAAKKKGMKVVCLLGKDGGKLKNMGDLSIIVPAYTADRIQEVHIKLIHTVIETVERVIFPEHYT